MLFHVKIIIHTFISQKTFPVLVYSVECTVKINGEKSRKRKLKRQFLALEPVYTHDSYLSVVKLASPQNDVIFSCSNNYSGIRQPVYISIISIYLSACHAGTPSLSVARRCNFYFPDDINCIICLSYLYITPLYDIIQSFHLQVVCAHFWSISWVGTT